MPILRTLQEKFRRAVRLDMALRFVWRSAPGWTIANAVLVLVQGPLPLLSLYLMKLTIDTVTDNLAAADTAGAFREAAVFVLLMGVVSLASSLIGQLAGLIQQAQSLTVTDYMHEIIHAKSIAVDLEYYENPDYYDTLQRAQREATYRPLRIVRGLLQLGQSATSLTAIGALLLSFHWVIALVLLLTVAPGFIISLRYSGKMYRWQREHTQVEREASYLNWLLTGNRHAKEIRLFDLGTLFMERFRKLRVTLRQEQLRLITRQAIESVLAQIITTIAVYGSYAFIVYRTIEGQASLGDLVIYYQAFQRGQGYLRQILSSLAGLYEDNLFLADLYEFLELEPRIVQPTDPQPVPQPIQRGVTLQHVSFRYPTGTRPVLEDISLTIRPGEKIALVGENGSGKTTLIKLLCRLYDPTSGTITVDGIDLRQFDILALRGAISVILQDYAHYNLTAQDNIWFGNAAHPPDQARIAAAAQHAGADSVIAGLKNGYQTVLGKLFQEGEELSIGEWQKVALSRAFLRESQIIILDEPTSSMDARAEYEVFERLNELAAGRTVILISHRFSTVRMADRIYVLANGRIAESGSHDELMALGGTYAHLFTTQARYYTI